MATLIAPISALLFAVAAMLVGHGLQSTLLPIRAEQAHFGDVAIGLMSSGYFAGFVAGCLLVPFAIMRAGHIRAFAAIVSIASAAALIHPLLVDPVTWTLARAVSGFGVAGFYMIVESWLNERATNTTRGMVMSIYVVVNYAAISAGQVMTTIFGDNLFVPFIIASMFVSLAVVPVALTRSQQPAPITLVRFRPRLLYQNSPTAIVGCILIGFAIGSSWTLATVFATRIGLTPDQAAFFVAAILVGGGLGQWPFGRISDRIDRRIVLGATCAGTIVVCGVLVFATTLPPLTIILLGGLFGIFSQPAYAIAVAHAFDYVEPDGHVETSSGMLLAFGIGSIVGPFCASMMMRAAGPEQLFVMIGITEAVLLAYIIYRVRIHDAPTEEDKTDWDLGSTAPVGGVITPEPLDAEDPDVVIPEEVFFEASLDDANPDAPEEEEESARQVREREVAAAAGDGVTR
ncbi:MFS family permease [Rhodobium orientis]|nr:MFS transporter [Rhodobium orientis]MBB4303906.1 MFS family permease [Rhodobium orientis]